MSAEDLHCMHANSCRLLSSTCLPQSGTRSVTWSRGIQWTDQAELPIKKKGKKKERRKDLRTLEHPVQGWTLHTVLHPDILTPRGKRSAMAERSSALDIPSLHSAIGICKVWQFSRTTEGRTNHFDQIRRSTKITQDQGEELKPIWGQQWWQHISGSQSGEWVISGFPLQI